jgi:membrane protein YqaA with SNARE-associated domain
MSATAVPSPEQQQRAKWDLLLLDLEQRAEQVRQLKRYEPWRLAFAGATAGAALFAAGAGVMALLLRMHS